MIAHARKRAKRLKQVLVPRRERNGRPQRGPRRESEADVLSVALCAPHRRSEANPLDERLGSALGRLRRSDAITEAQYGVGKAFAAVAARYGRDILGRSPHVHGIDPAGLGGRWLGLERSAADIRALRTSWDDIAAALRDTREARDSLAALTLVCVLDRDPYDITLGHLRVGLNALRRLWG